MLSEYERRLLSACGVPYHYFCVCEREQDAYKYAMEICFLRKKEGSAVDCLRSILNRIYDGEGRKNVDEYIQNHAWWVEYGGVATRKTGSNEE